MTSSIWSSARCPIPNHRLPLLIEVDDGRRNLQSFAQQERDTIGERLLEHGALLFRGFDVGSTSAFRAAVDALSVRQLDYVYRSTPRTTVEDKIFTATIYPPDLEIPLHNENAYQRDWPMRVVFYCAKPAATGGETPLADMRRVSSRLGSARLDRFEARQVKYVRTYRPYLDLSWQTVFQTQEPAEVERYCQDHDLTWRWIDEDTLRTEQICQGTARHPQTGERMFFNQAHLFHVSSLGEETASAMLNLFGKDALPRHSCFGDGEDIAAHELDAVREAFNAEAITFPWQTGDVLLVDNMQVAHGRRPFTGERQVYVSLCDPFSMTRPLVDACEGAHDPVT